MTNIRRELCIDTNEIKLHAPAEQMLDHRLTLPVRSGGHNDPIFFIFFIDLKKGTLRTTRAQDFLNILY